jgi:hypothetical protein
MNMCFHIHWGTHNQDGQSSIEYYVDYLQLKRFTYDK